MKSLKERKAEALAEAATWEDAGWDGIAADNLLAASFYTQDAAEARQLHLRRAEFYAARGLNAEATSAFECAVIASQDLGTAAEADARHLVAKHFYEIGYKRAAIVETQRVLGTLAVCTEEPGLKKVKKELRVSVRKWRQEEGQSASEVAGNNRFYRTARRLGQGLAALYSL